MKSTTKFIEQTRALGYNVVKIFVPKSTERRLREYAIPAEIRRRILSRWSVGQEISGTLWVYCPSKFYGEHPWALPAPYRNYKTKLIKP